MVRHAILGGSKTANYDGKKSSTSRHKWNNPRMKLPVTYRLSSFVSN